MMRYSIININQEYRVEIEHLVGKIHMIIDEKVMDYHGMNRNDVDAFVDNMLQDLESFEPEG